METGSGRLLSALGDVSRCGCVSPAEGSVVLCQDLLCASWVSGWASRPERGQSPPKLSSARECDPVRPAPPARAPTLFHMRPLQGPPMLAPVEAVVSRRPRRRPAQLPEVLLAGPLCSEPASQPLPGWVHAPLSFPAWLSFTQAPIPLPADRISIRQSPLLRDSAHVTVRPL